ncbi:MAG: porin family protein [Bacteroidales bacterium]|jgi:hypothetical protein
MRTRFLLLIALLAVMATAQAQFKPVHFGLKAGPNISWIRPNVDKYESDGGKLGAAWGFVTEINFSENHSLATGFNMLFNGGTLKFPYSADTTLLRNYKLKFFEVPITLKMRTNRMGGFYYFGQIGLGTAFNLGAKAEDAINDGEYGDRTKYKDIFFIRESLIIGAGAEYELPGGTRLGLSLIYNNGFTDILSGRNEFLNEKEKGAPNFFGIEAFVLF